MRLDEMVDRYIVTAAEYGAKANHKQLDAYERYADKWGAEIVVIPVEGQHKDEPMNDRVQQYTMTTNKVLNHNLEIKDWAIKAQRQNPLTGLKRLRKSMILGSPKQHLEFTANSPRHSPHAIMSTGACTLPSYKRNTIGLKAQEDHVQGAILVEVEDDKTFHFRQATNNKDGSFIDLGIKYTANNEPEFVGVDTLVMADLHDHQKEDNLYKTTLQMIDELKPKMLVGHDIFDAYSISHHDLKQHIRLGDKANKGELNLKEELYNLGVTVHELASKTGTFYAVKSNHDEHLTRYLQEGRFIQDPQNLEISLKLASALLEGKDPVEEGIKLAYGSTPKNMKFLQRDDELKRYGVELGFHGDIGPRGSRGSPIGLEYSLRNAVIGHGHAPYIRKNLMSVGAMMLNPDYAKGSAGSTVCAHAVINGNGKKQLINIFEDRYTA